MDVLFKYKKELLSAVIASLLTGVISLSVGLYSIKKSFDLAQDKEHIHSLRLSISHLKFIERELDRNLSLLLNQDFQTHIVYIEIPEEEKEIKSTFGESLRIHSVEAPEDLFVTMSWLNTEQLSEIEFDLIQDIQDLYLRFERVSRRIEDIKYLYLSTVFPLIDPSRIKRIDNINELIQKDITVMSQEKIVNLKRRINNEIDALKNRLRTEYK